LNKKRFHESEDPQEMEHKNKRSDKMLKKSIITRHNGIRDKNYKDVLNGTSSKRQKPEQKSKNKSTRRTKSKPSFLGYISQDEEAEEGSNNPENKTPKKEKLVVVSSEEDEQDVDDESGEK
jgi:hypothetical protein